MRKSIILIIFLLIFTGCVAERAYKMGVKLETQHRWDEAIEYYTKAVIANPKDVRARLALSKALLRASLFHEKKGEELEKKKEYRFALIEYEKALSYDPNNLSARRGKFRVLKKIEKKKEEERKKTQIELAKEKAKAKPMEKTTLQIEGKKKISLIFKKKQSLRQIFTALKALSGINILFDKDFKDIKLSIEIEDISLLDAIGKLCLLSGNKFKILDEKTVIIYPDTESKAKQYRELVVKNFYLSNAKPEVVAKELQRIAKINVISINKELRMLTIRTTPEKVPLAEKIVEANDKGKAEVLLDIEIIEVNRKRMKQYGIELSSYSISQSLSLGAEGTEAGAIRGNMFRYLNSGDFLFILPSLFYRLIENDTHSRVIAKPQIRGLEGEKINIKLGDKIPTPVTTFVPIATGGVNQQPITSYQLIDVGLDINITPYVHHNGEVTIEMDFSFTFITQPGTSYMPPSLGNRKVKSIIRLRDGETAMLAGLIRDSERTSLKGLPGLLNIPYLRHLFGVTEKEAVSTDIIFTITPHIIKMPEIREEDLLLYKVGTEKELGLKK